MTNKGGGIIIFKKLRKMSGLDQTFVAEQLGVTQGAVSQWETGETLPRAELLPKLAALYNCTTDELLASEPKKYVNKKENENGSKNQRNRN